MSHTQRIIKRLDRRIGLVIVSLLAVLWLQAPRLVDRFQVDEDFRSFYWMNNFQDPALFLDDQLRGDDYTIIRLPWGALAANRLIPIIWHLAAGAFPFPDLSAAGH
jgi:hypothetical protein